MCSWNGPWCCGRCSELSSVYNGFDGLCDGNIYFESTGKILISNFLFFCNLRLVRVNNVYFKSPITKRLVFIFLHVAFTCEIYVLDCSCRNVLCPSYSQLTNISSLKNLIVENYCPCPDGSLPNCMYCSGLLEADSIVLWRGDSGCISLHFTPLPDSEAPHSLWETTASILMFYFVLTDLADFYV